MKVVLLNPPTALDKKTFIQTGDHPPLGLMNIASVIKKERHSVEIIDSSVERHDITDSVKAIMRKKPDIIGLTSMTSNYHIVKSIASELKKVSNIPLILGGLHATTMTGSCLDSGLFDFVISGEGELSFTKLADAIDKNKSKDIPGVNYLIKGKKKINPSKFIENITEFPIKDWSLVDIKKYRPSNASYMKKPAISTMISRGCKNGCTFCASKSIFGLKFRAHSEEQIREELGILKEKGIKDINFWDINFASDREHTIKVSKIIAEFGFSWNITTRCDSVDYELLRIMAKNGCYSIGYGIEAGTQDTLDKINKNYSIDLIKKTIRDTKKTGIRTKCYFSLGYPWQDKEDIRKTIEFAKELNPHMVTFSIITPYPGSDLFDDVKSKLISSDFIDMTHRSAKYNVSKHFSTDELISMMNKAYTEFYVRPKHIIQSISSIRTFTDIKRMIQSIDFILGG